MSSSKKKPICNTKNFAHYSKIVGCSAKTGAGKYIFQYDPNICVLDKNTPKTITSTINCCNMTPDNYKISNCTELKDGNFIQNYKSKPGLNCPELNITCIPPNELDNSFTDFNLAPNCNPSNPTHYDIQVGCTSNINGKSIMMYNANKCQLDENTPPNIINSKRKCCDINDKNYDLSQPCVLQKDNTWAKPIRAINKNCKSQSIPCSNTPCDISNPVHYNNGPTSCSTENNVGSYLYKYDPLQCNPYINNTPIQIPNPQSPCCAVNKINYIPTVCTQAPDGNWYQVYIPYPGLNCPQAVLSCTPDANNTNQITLQPSPINNDGVSVMDVLFDILDPITYPFMAYGLITHPEENPAQFVADLSVNGYNYGKWL